MRRETIVGHNFNKKNDNNFIVIFVLLLVIIFFVSLKYIEKTSIISNSERKTAKPTVRQTAEPIPQKSEEPSVENVQEVKQAVVLSKIESANNSFGADVQVLEKATSKQIVGNLPQMLSDEFNIGERVNFYTKISPDKIPLSLQHVWINPAGEVYYAINLHAYVKPTSDVWSYVVIPPGNEGEWTVQVKVGQKVVDSKSFVVE